MVRPQQIHSLSTSTCIYTLHRLHWGQPATSRQRQFARDIEAKAIPPQKWIALKTIGRNKKRPTRTRTPTLHDECLSTWIRLWPRFLTFFKCKLLIGPAKTHASNATTNSSASIALSNSNERREREDEKRRRRKKEGRMAERKTSICVKENFTWNLICTPKRADLRTTTWPESGAAIAITESQRKVAF